MPVCPNCNVEFRQRKDGRCPNELCGEPLQIWRGFAFREGLGSPPNAVLEHFERLVSAKTSRIQKKPIVWRIPRKSSKYRRELASAERLLDYCEGDYSLVTECLDTLFGNPQFRTRNYDSLATIFNAFTLAQAIVEANREKQEQKQEKVDTIVRKIMQREDVFS